MNNAKLNKILITLIILFSFSAPSIADTIPQSESDAARISMLEKALAPSDPDTVASMFAKANKDRNGAVQFMLFSDKLKNKYKGNWPYWVSGTSSPWITSYAIKKSAHNKNVFQFIITYQWATADGPFKPSLLQNIGMRSAKYTYNHHPTFSKLAA